MKTSVNAQSFKTFSRVSMPCSHKLYTIVVIVAVVANHNKNGSK